MKTVRDKLTKSNSGFTLVELLIAISMFSFVLLLIATVFIQMNRSYAHGLTTKRVHEEGRSVLDSIGRELRVASSGNQVTLECIDSPCSSEVATKRLCFDNIAYYFKPPDSAAESNGVLRRAEGVACDTMDEGSGSNAFNDQVQPQFFKVTEVVANKTYRLELLVSSAEYNRDLFSSSGGIRDTGCKPGVAGSQFCRVVLLQKLVTLRSN